MSRTTVQPEVVDALADQLLHPLALAGADHLLHPLQLPLQLLDAAVAQPRRHATLQDLLHQEVHVLQVHLDLAHGVVPQLEAGVALDAGGEDAGEAAGALVAAPPRRPLTALAGARQPVALGHLGAQQVAVAL